MPKQNIQIIQDFPVPAEQVWSFYNDHNRWNEIIPLPIKRIVNSSDEKNINGVGSVRLIGTKMIGIEETIITSSKPKIIEYTISKGSPFKNYKGSMQFYDNKDGTSTLEYIIEFDTPIPMNGNFLTQLLVFGLGVKRLAKKFDKNPNFA